MVTHRSTLRGVLDRQLHDAILTLGPVALVQSWLEYLLPPDFFCFVSEISSPVKRKAQEKSGGTAVSQTIMSFGFI